MSMTRLRPLAGLAVASAFLLAGCGGLHPGAAVLVGNETITMSHVDRVAGDYCQAIEKQLQGNHQVVPQRYLRGGVAGTLALTAAARQLADQYGVTAGKQYDQQVATLQSGVAQLPDSVRASVVEVESAKTYVEGVEAAVGQKLLAGQSAAQQGYTQSVARGKQALDDWLTAHDVQFDPQLGVKVDKGAIVPADTSLSFPVGTAATQGAATTPDQTYAASLPDAHRCG